MTEGQFIIGLVGVFCIVVITLFVWMSKGKALTNGATKGEGWLSRAWAKLRGR